MVEVYKKVVYTGGMGYMWNEYGDRESRIRSPKEKENDLERDQEEK